MTVTAPVSLSKIVAEFGGPNNLSAYVRGGAYVPNTTANANVSTTVAGLAISQFLGATNYIPISVTVTPSSVSKTNTGTLPQGPAGPTASVTATVTGGSGTITRSWTRVSGDANTTISSTTASSVTFSRTNCLGGVFYTSVWKCTASDGTSSGSDNVSVSLDYENNS